jgi:glycine cleavage system H protein
MFPWIYGFHWSPGHLIFLGLFWGIAGAVMATVAIAGWRMLRDLRNRRADSIAWQVEFQDLPSGDRACRHALTGELKGRTCPRAFDCRGCEVHARLPEPAAGMLPDDELGLPYPAGRSYHRGHAWARLEPDGTVTVGLDELGKRLIGPPDRVELPAPGSRLGVNSAACRMVRSGDAVRILSPVAGEVLESGGEGRDWLLRVKPAGPLDTRHLLRGAEVRAWVLREMERLHLLLSAEAVGPALADGGVPLDDFAAGQPAADWDAVRGRMFLQN